MTGRRISQVVNRTALDISLTFSRQFLASLLQLGLIMVIARALGPEGAGFFAIALLLPGVLGQLCNLGIVSANVYFVASGRVSIERAWAASRDLMLVVSILGTGLGCGIVVTASDLIFPGVPQSVLLAAMAVFPVSLLAGLVVGMFQAMQDFRAFNVTVISQPLLAFIGTVALWGGAVLSLEAVIWCVAAAHAGALLLALWLLARRLKLWTAVGVHLDYLGSALSYGLKAHLSNIIGFLNYRLDLLLVNLLAGPSAAGLYLVAVRLTEQLWMLSQAVSTVIFPRLSAMVDNDGSREEFTPVVARTVLWATLLASGVLAALAQPLIVLLFGPEFRGAVIALWLLLPGVVMLSGARVLANDIAARGWVGTNLILSTAVLVVNTAANIVLIPSLGIAGAGIATSLSYGLNLLARLALHHHHIGVVWWKMLLPARNDYASLKRVVARKN